MRFVVGISLEEFKRYYATACMAMTTQIFTCVEMKAMIRFRVIVKN